MLLLKNWIVSVPSPYVPPENRGAPTVKGVLQENYRDFKIGDCITSSAIVKIEGRKLTTQSGSVYVLDGDPHPNYLKFCKDNLIVVDLDDPLKVYREDAEKRAA